MIEKKRIDIIHISCYYPPDIGGLELAAGNIVNEQLMNNEVVQVATGKDRNIKYQSENHIIRFNRYKILGKITVVPRLFLYLLKTNKKIYYIHYGPPLLSEIGFIISKLKNKKIVIHIHLDAEGTTSLRKFLLNLYHKTIIRFILKRTDAIIVPTRSYKLYISKKYGVKESQIHCVPYGINVEDFSQVRKIEHGGFNILFIGNLKIQKNIPLLINAFDKLANEFNDMNLYIIGSGSEEKNLKLLASKKKSHNNIHFIGKIVHENLPEYFKNIDLFVLPSLNESAGIVILEAFAAKVPVVATKCLGVVDLIGNNRGILVKNNDVESLIKGIKKVYYNEVNILKMINKAYDFVNKNGSWKNITKRINNILRKL